MTHPLDISGDDVVAWSNRIGAAAELPALVRRLLFATAPLQGIEMRADGGTRLSGVDGTIVSATATPFCPDGPSIWEFSVEKKRTKLDTDYTKRKGVDGYDTAEVTYVAVSARRVSAKKKWIADKKKDGRWRDVRLIDADDLAAWIGTAPAVARWFGEKAGRPSFDLTTLEEYLEGWRRRTTPPLPSELLVAGRRRTQNARLVTEWAERGKEHLVVSADTPEGAISFVAAALDTAASRDTWHARTVIVESQEALRWVMRSDSAQPPIVLPHYPNFDPSHVDATTRVVLPLGQKRPTTAIALEDVPFSALEPILERSGLRGVDARHLARESRGNLSALQRLCGYEPTAKWIAFANRTALSTMLVCGAWCPGVAGDEEALAKLGTSHDAVDAFCDELSRDPYRITVKDFGVMRRANWMWLSESVVWSDACSLLSTTTLREFRTVARSILGEEDPKFTLPMDARFAAALHGKVLRYSPPLRAGVARSLARLAQADSLLQDTHGPMAGSTLADIVVRDVLGPGWRMWASLDRLLPWLAEAAPRAFLDALQGSLGLGEEGVCHTFKEESFFGHPHVPVVWALETLAWFPEHFPRAVQLLGRFAMADVGGNERGRTKPRPVDTLASLFHPHLPQTDATAEVRFGALRQLHVDAPNIAFEVVASLLGQGSFGFIFENHQPEIVQRPTMSRVERRAVMANEVSENVNRLVDAALEFAGTSSSRWARLLPILSRLDDLLEARALAVLRSSLSEVTGDRMLLWAALRDTLHWDSAASARENAATRSALYEMLTPEDPVARIAWLFERSAELPNGSDDLAAEAKQIAAEREQALVGLWDGAERWQNLRRLALSVSDGWPLGSSLARGKLALDVEQGLLALNPECFPIQVRASYIGNRTAMQFDANWLATVLRSLVAEARVQDAIEVALALPHWKRNWDVLDAVDRTFADQHWRAVERLFVSDEPPEIVCYAIERLLAVGNAAVATSVASAAITKIPAPLALRVLQALEGPELVKCAHAGAGAYSIGKLLNHVSSNVLTDALAMLELRFLPLLEHARYTPKHLSEAIGDEPAHFVSLVTAAYRGDNDDEAASVANSATSEAAGRILELWKGYPGDASPNDACDDLLYSWSKSALGELDAAGRFDGARIELARVLARAHSADGVWPCLAVRRLLEEESTSDLSDSIEVARRNMRGGTTRAPGEGGRQERLLVKQYEGWASAVRIPWPSAARLLDSLAATYRREASAQDASARSLRRREGFDIPTSSDELDGES